MNKPLRIPFLSGIIGAALAMSACVSPFTATGAGYMTGLTYKALEKKLTPAKKNVCFVVFNTVQKLSVENHNEPINIESAKQLLKQYQKGDETFPLPLAEKLVSDIFTRLRKRHNYSEKSPAEQRLILQNFCAGIRSATTSGGSPPVKN